MHPAGRGCKSGCWVEAGRGSGNQEQGLTVLPGGRLPTVSA